MKTTLAAANRISRLWTFLLLLALATVELPAEQFGLFTYRVDGDGVTITGCQQDATGEVVIPEEIAEMPVTAIGWYAFGECKGITRVTIPPTVTTISSGAFASCTALEEVSLAEGLVTIEPGDGGGLGGPGAFQECTALSRITIPASVERIGSWAFAGCTALGNVAIEDGVSTIGNQAFLDCVGLAEVVLPPSVTFIGYRAFAGCTGLAEVAIPKEVSRLGPFAFRNCSNLQAIKVDAANPYYLSEDGVLFDVAKERLLEYPAGREGAYAVPSGVNTIYGWECIDELFCTDGGAFENCRGLTDIALPDSIEELGPFAFKGCSSLQSIVLPNGVLRLGSYVLAGCTGLTSVTIPEGVRWISWGAFEGCTALASVSLPSSLESVGGWGFSGCTGLTSITVADENPNYSSEAGVLFDAAGTTLILFPQGRAGAYTIPSSVTEIGDYLFSGCSGLTSVKIPSSVTKIGRYAFHGCTGLTSVTIPTSVTVIGQGAFSDCSGLTSVTIPEGVAEIGWGAFSGCTGLTRVTIPSSVTRIGASAFRNCSWLTNVTIPEGVTWIGEFAFSDCRGLAGVVFQGTAPSTLRVSAFENTAPDFTIYYLSGSSGFNSPTWQGYPAIEIDPTIHPAAPWLLSHTLPYDADLHQDLNGDGVSLLMAYALDLDPEQNLNGSLPVPVVRGNELFLSFSGQAPGITYRVQTSTDLRNWSSDGVVMTGPDADGMRSALVTRDGPQGFLRLVVE